MTHRKLSKLTKKAVHSLKKKKESLRDRLQHGENAWLAAEESFNKQLAQLFGHLLRFEKEVTERLEVIEKALNIKSKKEIKDENRNIRSNGTKSRRNRG